MQRYERTVRRCAVRRSAGLRCPSPSALALPPRLLRPEGLLLHRGLQPDGSEARTPPVLKVRHTTGSVAHRGPGRAAARS